MPLGELVALIPAAGQSRRMAAGINKQYLTLDNKPVLYYSLAALLACGIKTAVVVVAPGEEGLCRREVLQPYGLDSKVQLVAGGARRQDSVYNGLLALPPETGFVVVHDGARPLVSPREVAAVIAAARDFGAAAVGVPVKNTIKVVDDRGFVLETPPREHLRAVQTPQVFSYKLLLEAHQSAIAGGYAGTDDASLVERLGRPVKVVPGSYRNIKVTTPEDLNIAAELLKVPVAGAGDG